MLDAGTGKIPCLGVDGARLVLKDEAGVLLAVLGELYLAVLAQIDVGDMHPLFEI